MIRNPAALQELMRSHDRAVSNLESVPGGMAALQRLYRDIQEPMLNAAQEQLGTMNPFASLASDSAHNASQSARAGVENREPLPNPWMNRSGSATGAAAAEGRRAAAPGGPTNGTDIFNSPGIQSLMQQMLNNPQLVENMTQTPYFQAMARSLTSNPELAAQTLGMNPLANDSSQLIERMRQMLPSVLQQIQSPAFVEAMTNPRVISAIGEIHHGLQVLQEVAPNLFSNITGFTQGMQATAMATNRTPATPATTATASGATTVSPAAITPATGTTNPAQQQLGQVMAAIINQMAATSVVR
ncbi:unnamed protein product [Soboliphyme baturini]|uniref:STI1 domain-containing protein n=1 Tax=Soboliphyme baturini TaxID=241478 RepID=A0A183IGP0_9BILA|nr:unnamed protein product [Soboliphyme baturini]